MKQKLLFILICLLGISNVNAQFKAPNERNSKALFSASPVQKDRQQLRASAAAGSLYFGYCDDNITQGIGVNQAGEISAAICMPASLSSVYAGKKITSIRIALDANSTNVSVWIRNSLSGANLVSQTVGNVNPGWTEVTLKSPFTIPTNDFYIGYSATGFHQIGFSGNPVYDACWLYSDLMGSQWDNVFGYGFGSLCIQAQIDVQNATILAVKPVSLQKSVQTAPNQNFDIQCSIKNYSSVDAANVKVSYQIDNQTPVSKVIQTSIAAMKEGSINIPVNAIASSGIYNFSVKILEINGQPNAFAAESLSNQIRVLSQSFPKKVVIEEGTGTWCGWCVKGAVGMEMMKQKYPDTFVGIAVHNKDPMTITAYDSYMTQNFINSFPEVVADRKSDLIGDPYDDASNFYQSEIALMPIAGIQLTGGFTDAAKNAISLKTVTTFGISSNNANFKLAYVLIENGVTGYSQANYYAGGGSGAMGGYENKPNPVTDMVFNDVARGIYSDPTGIPGSIPASITEMKPVENTYTINLPNSIQNKDQLAVAVMLININTGEIENADIIGVGIIGQPIAVTGVSLNHTSAAMLPGNTLQLTAIVAPTYATNKKVTWSSSNPTVASVDAAGKVTALAKGTATITVTTEDGNKTATCEVTVISLPCDNPTASGTAGDLIWTLCPDGTLTIIGQGTMPNYYWDNQPWNSYFSSITTVKIEEGVKNIGNWAFNNNDAYSSSITSITLPNSLLKIGSNAFGVKLTAINIHENVVDISPDAFSVCWSLSEINVDANNKYYCSKDGVLFNKNQDTLIRFPSGKQGSFEIPYGVINIGDYSLKACFNLSAVMIPNSVISIGNWAFEGSSMLSAIDIPNNVVSIGDGAFYACTNIKSFTLGSELTSIGSEAFGYCLALEEININPANTQFSSLDGVLYNKNQDILITCPVGKIGDFIIPNTVSTIGYCAFRGCRNLTSITIPETVTGIEDAAFGAFLDNCSLNTMIVNWKKPLAITAAAFENYIYGSPSNIQLDVPPGTKALYQAASVWKDFGTIVEQSPTSIPYLTAKTSAYLNDGKLYVNSPIAEMIQIYSTEGTLLYGFQKPAGETIYRIDRIKGSVLIVKGSSGWIKKVN